MTVRQKIEAKLCKMGIFESKATQIMDYAIPLIDAEMAAEKTSGITWNRPADEYPDALYAALFITHINRHVLAWAEANMPLAWWKPMFMPSSERDALFASAGIE